MLAYLGLRGAGCGAFIAGSTFASWTGASYRPIPAKVRRKARDGPRLIATTTLTLSQRHCTCWSMIM